MCRLFGANIQGLTVFLKISGFCPSQLFVPLGKGGKGHLGGTEASKRKWQQIQPDLCLAIPERHLKKPEAECEDSWGITHTVEAPLKVTVIIEITKMSSYFLGIFLPCLYFILASVLVRLL